MSSAAESSSKTFDAMNTQAHTSGPWGVSRHATPESFPQFGVYAESGNGRALAHVVSHGTATSAETDSNARLIAAAPEMLEALRNVAEIMSGADYSHVKADMARAICRRAIASAERAGE